MKVAKEVRDETKETAYPAAQPPMKRIKKDELVDGTWYWLCGMETEIPGGGPGSLAVTCHINVPVIWLGDKFLLLQGGSAGNIDADKVDIWGPIATPPVWADR